MKILLSTLSTSPYQVRAKMNGQPLAELKESMSQVGQAVPIKVRPIKDGHEIVYGHRRVEAARQLGWTEIEAVVESLSDEEAMLQGLAENIDREDLTDMEKARAFKRVADEFGKTQAEIGAQFGFSRQRAQEIMAILQEPEPIQRAMEGNAGRTAIDTRTVSRVRIALGNDKQARVAVIEKAQEEGLSSRQAEKIAKAVAAAPNAKVKNKLIEHEFNPFIHDADRIKEQAKRTPGKDPVVQEREPREDAEWKETPEVAEMLRRLLVIEKEWAPEFLKLIEIGKLDEAGYAFVSGKIKRAVKALEKVRQVIK